MHYGLFEGLKTSVYNATHRQISPALALNPKPQNRGIRHLNANPARKTLKEPQTLNPKPYSLNPKPLKEPLKAPSKEPFKEPLKEPFKESFKEPLKDPFKEPLKEPLKDPLRAPSPRLRCHASRFGEPEPDSQEVGFEAPLKESFQGSFLGFFRVFKGSIGLLEKGSLRVPLKGSIGVPLTGSLRVSSKGSKGLL